MFSSEFVISSTIRESGRTSVTHRKNGMSIIFWLYSCLDLIIDTCFLIASRSYHPVAARGWPCQTPGIVMRSLDRIQQVYYRLPRNIPLKSSMVRMDSANKFDILSSISQIFRQSRLSRWIRRATVSRSFYPIVSLTHGGPMWR